MSGGQEKSFINLGSKLRVSIAQQDYGNKYVEFVVRPTDYIYTTWTFFGNCICHRSSCFERTFQPIGIEKHAQSGGLLTRHDPDSREFAWYDIWVSTLRKCIESECGIIHSFCCCWENICIICDIDKTERSLFIDIVWTELIGQSEWLHKLRKVKYDVQSMDCSLSLFKLCKGPWKWTQSKIQEINLRGNINNSKTKTHSHNFSQVEINSQYLARTRTSGFRMVKMK